eukprot:GHVH01007700.1.p1 GENE.GHVH01007700.1~~GHVH01007700.1.p1  ORF type:complete len:699 (+),score=106.50 GHVH01007700.1:157-2253(+)
MMPRTKDKRNRRRGKSSSSSNFNHQGNSDDGAREGPLEGRSIADARKKLNENRNRILKEMGIESNDDGASIMNIAADAEILRETVIEHKIQIPRKQLVKKTVMREVEVEETVIVSEEVMDKMRYPQRIITVGRPSMLPSEDTIVDVPETVVKRNFIEKRVPRVVERTVEVPDDDIHVIPKEVTVNEVEYVDEVVQLEEEYVQYIDVEVPEIVEVPNFIEVTEEKYSDKDVTNEINHHTPKAFELEHVVTYESPTLKPVYKDEYYTLNVPRLIQVPVFEDLLPPGNRNTLYLLKDRFDEMAKMRDPVAMCFAEDYAVQANETFYTDHTTTNFGISHPKQEPIQCGVPESESMVSIPNHGNTFAYQRSIDRSRRNCTTTSSSPSSRGSSLNLQPQPPKQKSKKGCCYAPPKNSASLAPESHQKKRKAEKSSKSLISGNTATTPVRRVPRNYSNNNLSSAPFPDRQCPSIPSQPTSVPHKQKNHFKPKITETFQGERVEKRSVDTDYVQQFVTNADPLNRHPPSALVTTPSVAGKRADISLSRGQSIQRSTQRDHNQQLQQQPSYQAVQQQPSYQAVQQQPSYQAVQQQPSYQDVQQQPSYQQLTSFQGTKEDCQTEGSQSALYQRRRTSSGLIAPVRDLSSVPPDNYGVAERRTSHNYDDPSRRAADTSSLYHDGAASRPAHIVRMNKNGSELIRPPTVR